MIQRFHLCEGAYNYYYNYYKYIQNGYYNFYLHV